MKKWTQLLLVSSFTALPQAQAAPEIAITRDASGAVIIFTGKLEAAEQITGPWTEVTNAPSPYTDALDGGRRFYRARETADIFSGSTALNWTLTGPLQEHFGLAFAGTPDGINPPLRLTP